MKQLLVGFIAMGFILTSCAQKEEVKTDSAVTSAASAATDSCDKADCTCSHKDNANCAECKKGGKECASCKKNHTACKDCAACKGHDCKECDKHAKDAEVKPEAKTKAKAKKK